MYMLKVIKFQLRLCMHLESVKENIEGNEPEYMIVTSVELKISIISKFIMDHLDLY